MFRRMFFGVMLLGFTMSATASGWSSPVTITNFFVWSHGGAYLTTTGNPNPDGCATTQMWYLDTNDVQFKSVWATILSAHAAGSTVSVQVDGCVNGRPQVRAIAVPAIW